MSGSINNCDKGGNWSVNRMFNTVDKCNGHDSKQCDMKVDQRIVSRMTAQLTKLWQQLLWGSRQRVQGSNGANAAQLSCPQGSTLTFQLNAGVSYGIGLRHGVTMHPRGRHLRDGMILLPHGTYTHTVREQKPPQQPYDHNWRGPWGQKVSREEGEGPYNEHRDIDSKRCYHRVASTSKCQPGELYCSTRHGAW